MYASQRLRFHQVFYEAQAQLRDMALDPRGFPGIANEFRQLKSSASTPSLRSRDSELVPMTRTTSESGGGNVRVVVRVRGFLPRGIDHELSSTALVSPEYRGRARSGMSCGNESRYPSHQAPDT